MTRINNRYKNMLKKIISIILVVFLWCLTGCTSVSDEEATDLLERDPSFKQILDEKKRIEEEIFSLKKEIKEKKKILNSRINVLRKEFKKEKAKADSEIKRLKHKLDPERNLIRENANLLSRNVRGEEAALKNIENTIKDLQKLISKEGTLDISKEEITRWRQRIKSLESEKRAIKKELKELKEDLGTLEVKLKLLK